MAKKSTDTAPQAMAGVPSSYLAKNPLSQPLKWHGGKNYQAKGIISRMPPHKHYVESFFGGGAVMLAKDAEGISEVANDLNGWLTNFWSVLQDPRRFELLFRMAAAMPFAEPHWEAAAAAMQAKPDVDEHSPTEAALIFFVLCRQSLAGRMESFAPLSGTRTRRGRNEQVSAWQSAIDGLPEVHERLQRVAIRNKPAIKVIQQEDGPDTLHYLDPPYVPETRSSPNVYGRFELSVADHEELLDTIKQCEGKVMISGYDSALYRHALSAWNRHEFDQPNNAAGGAKKARMTEIVWCNF